MIRKLSNGQMSVEWYAKPCEGMSLTRVHRELIDSKEVVTESPDSRQWMDEESAILINRGWWVEE